MRNTTRKPNALGLFLFVTHYSELGGHPLFSTQSELKHHLLSPTPLWDMREEFMSSHISKFASGLSPLNEKWRPGVEEAIKRKWRDRPQTAELFVDKLRTLIEKMQAPGEEPIIDGGRIKKLYFGGIDTLVEHGMARPEAEMVANEPEIALNYLAAKRKLVERGINAESLDAVSRRAPRTVDFTLEVLNLIKPPKPTP